MADETLPSKDHQKRAMRQSAEIWYTQQRQLFLVWRVSQVTRTPFRFPLRPQYTARVLNTVSSSSKFEFQGRTYTCFLTDVQVKKFLDKLADWRNRNGSTCALFEKISAGSSNTARFADSSGVRSIAEHRCETSPSGCWVRFAIGLS